MDVKAWKPYLLIAALAVAAISFIVMVFGFFVRQTVTGYFASWVFAASFCLFVNLGIPDDDFKGPDAG